jgi:hypothetical protein
MGAKQVQSLPLMRMVAACAAPLLLRMQALITIATATATTVMATAVALLLTPPYHNYTQIQISWLPWIRASRAIET